MGHAYQAVGWNRQKKIYDLVLWGGILLYLGLFIGLGAVFHPNATAETLLIRGLATAAFLLLHIILMIGPLCRLNPKFLPLLYNRRHMGVSMFLLALAHSIFSIIQFHTLGDINPLLSVLVSNTHFDSIPNFPFQPLGLLALVILLFMAATSHDYWLANLSAPTWKALHMMVYVAYGLIVLHVALGVLQAETSPILTVLMAVGLLLVLGLHLIATRKEATIDKLPSQQAVDGYIHIGPPGDIPNNRAITANVAGERVAIFRYDDKISAVSSVCQHQNGPLGEGKIIDGFITCPWHGYQYCPHNGKSPAPFTEQIPTFDVKIVDGELWVAAKPNPAGTEVQPAVLSNSGSK